MKKNRFFVFMFAFSAILFSCATEKKPIQENLGLKGKTFQNPKEVTIRPSSKSEMEVFAGEFYRFDFSSYAKDKKYRKNPECRNAIVEVLDRAGNRISFYTIGFSVKHFYDTFYISPNAARVNVALSNSEYSYSKVKEYFITQKSDLPVMIYNKDKGVVAGEMNGLDFTMFNGYFARDGMEVSGNTFAITECFDENGKLINRKVFPSYATGSKKGFLIPVKTRLVRFSVSSARDSYYTCIDMVRTTASSNPLTITNFVGGSFRTLDFNVYQDKIQQNYGLIEYLDDDGKVFFTDYVNKDENDKLSGKVYVPKSAVNANVILSDTSSSYENALDYIDVMSSLNPSGFKTPYSYFDADRVKTNEINGELERFINHLDRNAFKKEPDLYIEFIVKRIEHITNNDFEKIKLYHDATYLTLWYKNENIGEPLASGDFRSAIKNGRGNSYAFSTLFKEFCRAGGFYCINVSGNAKKIDHKLKLFPPKFSGIPLVDEDGKRRKLNKREIIEYNRTVEDYNREAAIYNERITIDYTVQNHFWNIVFVNDNAYFVDCSLDSRESDAGTANKKYSTDWLFVHPDEFIKSHFPMDEEFQLLSKPLTLSEFAAIQYMNFGKDVVKIEPMELELTKKERKILQKYLAAEELKKLEINDEQNKLVQEKERLEQEKLRVREEQDMLYKQYDDIEKEILNIENEQRKLKRKLERMEKASLNQNIQNNQN